MEKLNKLLRTKFERDIFTYRESQCDDETTQTLSESIKIRLRESTLGSFLYHLNSTQLQEVHVQEDKLDRVRFDMVKNLVNLKKLERVNDICEDVLDLIDDLLLDNPTGQITINNALQELKVLRLTGSKIGIMDGSLCSLPGLQVLVMVGNCLQDFPGGLLPRGLLMLELCCNMLHSISQLLHENPPQLLYLGLARNYLTQDVLRPLSCAQSLYHLDLAHNDIEDLTVVVTTCSELVNLSSLVLVGNPCSMASSYSTYICSKLPKLIFLDGEILKKSAEMLNCEKEHDLSGSLQISLYRIMGIPQPPNKKVNNKKVKHSFRIEVECPLLQLYAPQRKDSFVKDLLLKEDITQEQEKGKEKQPKNLGKIERKDHSKTYHDKSTRAETKGKDESPKKPGKEISRKSKETHVMTLNDENLEEISKYENDLKKDYTNSESNFISTRKEWGKIIEFGDPTIEVPHCDLFALRNVFKSNLTLRVVHLKSIPPANRKSGGEQKKQTKSKKVLDDEVVANKVQPEEHIMVVYIFCSLKTQSAVMQLKKY